MTSRPRRSWPPGRTGARRRRAAPGARPPSPGTLSASSAPQRPAHIAVNIACHIEKGVNYGPTVYKGKMLLHVVDYR